MNEPLYGVYGVSGFGREVLPIAREQLKREGVAPERLVFVDDAPTNDIVNGHYVLTYAEFFNRSAKTHHIVLAISNSAIRENLSNRAANDGLHPWSVTAESVVVMDEVAIGAGAVLCPFVILTSNIRIGRHFHANIYSYVAHDCVIGDFVTFAPGVKCNGNIVIEDHAYIGTGAVLKQGMPDRPMVIGKGAVVGMGAVVTKNVPPGITVVGNPAKPFVKR